MTYITLGDLIAVLSTVDPTTRVAFGFGRPMSYRGYYEQCAFAPERDTTIGEMLAHARGALGETFEGYKGGEYTFDESTEVWVSEYGRSGGDRIGATLLSYWTGRDIWAEEKP